MTTHPSKSSDNSPFQPGIKVERFFTKPGDDGFRGIEWELRTASIVGEGGKIVFEQDDVEFPKQWSQTAVNVVASKYFRGQLGTPERERSVRQLISRVADTITSWGMKDDYFANQESADNYRAELRHLLVSQKMAFNSPVWFNVGIKAHPQCSACFVSSVEDSMESILDLVKTEGMLFKGGSGSGTNLSSLRSSKETLVGGGTASGPVSFMRGYDAFAGAIKSGGATRRSAKMVILNVDHPDIEEFIWCKAKEEKKAHALIAAGYDGSFDGEAYKSVSFQNANNSVRVTDEFMEAVQKDLEWTTRAVRDGSPVETVKARKLLRDIAQATWECGDPGMQYDTTINEWHTCSGTDRINASNPCCFVGETLVETSEGRIPIKELVELSNKGELPMALSYDFDTRLPVARLIKKAWVAGETQSLVRVRTEKGLEFSCTPEHVWYLRNGSGVPAKDLKVGALLQTIEQHRGDVNDRIESVETIPLSTPVSVYDIEVEDTHNFGIACAGQEHALVVANSEYMFLDDSACNLASLNLRRFADQGVFDTESFKKAVAVTILAQEIIVGNAKYPTEDIKENSLRFRPLGLGYANLGSLLMSLGLPYDSAQARAWCGAITALMTGWAYRTSAVIARNVTGPFAGYLENEQPFLAVMEKHRDHIERIESTDLPVGLLASARQAWHEAIIIGLEHGFRNAQTTVLAPCGTIGFMMAADTTGIEPDIALIKYKRLVGGGTIKMVNGIINNALAALGYDEDQRKAIVEYIDREETIEGAPGLSDDHLPVFDCAFRAANGTRSIHYMGHIRMMAAAQPFISGAISKCLAGDTLIVTDKGLIRLASLYKGTPTGSVSPIELQVSSRSGTETASGFYFDGVKKSVKVVLEDSRVVDGAATHKLLVASGGSLVWKMLGDLHTGDYVASKIGSELWGTDAPLVFSPSASYGSQHKETKYPLSMTPSLGLFLGMLTADGHVARSVYTIGITKNCLNVLNKFRQLAKELFNLDAKEVVASRNGVHSSSFHSKGVVEFLDNIGFTKERIPEAILCSSRETVIAYISGLYLDGWVTQSISISQKHNGVISDLQQVWLNLGVHTYQTDNIVDGTNYRVLHVSGGYRHKAVSVLQFLEPHKVRRAAKLTNGQNRMVFPFRDLRSSVLSELARDTRTKNILIATAAAYLPDKIKKESEELFKYVYTSVVSIQEGKEQPLYDLSVPGSRSYIANGVVSHNTCNLPEDATTEDVEDTYMEAWKAGLKAIAIYRDGCKRAQPVSTSKTDPGTRQAPAVAPPAPTTPTTPSAPAGVRRRLPDERRALAHKFAVGGHEGYIHVGLYDSGEPGEIFIKMAKEGSTISGLMDSFATAVSIALQHGVPLRLLVDKFSRMRFEPSGFTGNPEIPRATSVMDYLFRWLGARFLREESAVEGAQKVKEAPAPLASKATVMKPIASTSPFSFLVRTDAPTCSECGSIMVPNGSCHKCINCGTTSGCS